MVKNMAEYQKLTPSEVTRIFSGMSPIKATRYFNKVMTNPGTPDANVDLFRQYRMQNENKFLSEEQMRGNRRSRGSWTEGRGFSGGYQSRDNGRTYDSYGGSHDNRGRSYDNDGNEQGGYHDGGRDQRYDGRHDNGFSSYYGAHNQGRGNNSGNGQRRGGFWSTLWKPKQEFDQMTPKEQKFFVGAFKRKNRSMNTAYSLRVLTNPETPVEDKKAMVQVVNSNPRLFFSRDKAGDGKDFRNDRNGGNRGNNRYNNRYNNRNDNGYDGGYYDPRRDV